MPLSKVGKIGFIGGGNMAEAFIKGLMNGGFPAEDIHFFEPNETRRSLMVERYGITCSDNNAALVAESDIIVLATKPQILEKVLGEVNGAFTDDKLLISILAGVTTTTLEVWVGRPTWCEPCRIHRRWQARGPQLCAPGEISPMKTVGLRNIFSRQSGLHCGSRKGRWMQ